MGDRASAADLIGIVMDKAAVSDRNALFAGLQAALVCMTNRSSSLTDDLRRIIEALDVGAPYGSPEHLTHLERKFASAPSDTSGTSPRP